MAKLLILENEEDSSEFSLEVDDKKINLLSIPGNVFWAIDRLRRTLDMPREVIFDRRPRQGKIGPYTFVSINGTKRFLCQLEADGVSLYTLRLIQDWLKTKKTK